MYNEKNYRPRLIDDKIDSLLQTYGAVCIEGPKWSGKTWTSMHHSKSSYFLGDPAGNFSNLKKANINLDFALEGEPPHLIDEWQTIPSLWDAVKYKVDETGVKGQFILTGSSTPTVKGILHSGTGRIGTVKMRTMSLYESGHSSGDVSLAALFNGSIKPISIKEPKLEELIDYIIRGGWPGSQSLSLDKASTVAIDYLRNVPVDMERIDGVRRDRRKVKALLRSLGRAESTMMSKKALAKDTEEFPDDKTTADSSLFAIEEYLDLFSKLFLIEDQPSFDHKLRSSIKALKSPKRHFSDPSLAAAAIEATPTKLMNDLETLGYLFEALCIRDLRVYAECNNASVYHYHDERDKEADAIVEMMDGSWGMFEIKLGFNQVDTAAENLLKLKSRFEIETGAKPAFLCVLCGICSMAYQREDGVFVVPLTTLTK